MAQQVWGSVYYIVYYIVYAVELFLVEDGIFHNRTTKKMKYAAMAGVYLLVLIPTILFLDKNSFVIFTLNMAVHIVLFQGTALSHIVHFGGVYLLTNMTENILFGIGFAFLPPSLKQLDMNTSRSGAVSLFFAALVTCVILYVISRKRTQAFFTYFRTLNWFQHLVIVMTAWNSTLLLGNVMFMTAHDESKKAGMLFAITIIFTGTALTAAVQLVSNIYHKDYFFKQNQAKEEIIQMQQMYFQNIYDNDREMRSFRHDIYSQLGCLRLLLEDGKTKEALEHLQVIGNHFEELAIQKCHTGNELLDVLMNQKIQEAEKKGIRIEIEGRMSQPDFMDTYDLCALFSNMLNNSIEACEAIQGQERLITVGILSHGNTILFQVANPATAEMFAALKWGDTTKADCRNHGFGMENIQRVVKKHGGEMEALFENGKLAIEIYFEK